MFQSHLLGQPIVIVGDLVNWQKALNAEFKSVAMNFPESFKKASGQTGTADKDTHAFQVSHQRASPQALVRNAACFCHTFSGILSRVPVPFNGLS